jgi:hypothetical protein
LQRINGARGTADVEEDFHESLVRDLKKVPFCPISVSDSNFNPRNTNGIPVVNIFVFLDLEQN